MHCLRKMQEYRAGCRMMMDKIAPVVMFAGAEENLFGDFAGFFVPAASFSRPDGLTG